jgi:nucleotide-binding universal stress UspA family protein
MLRIQKILCPIDFSEFSRHAFDRAVAVAHGFDASVTALYVVPTPPGPIVPYVAPVNLEPLMLRDVDRERIVREMTQFLAVDGTTRVPVACTVVEAPSIHREILVQADQLPADLIVMGSHGRSGFERLLLGSVTEKVLRSARAPVLTAGRTGDVIPTGQAPFKRILCAIDFSDCSVAALAYAGALAERAHAALAALYVVEWTPLGYDPLVGPPTDLAGYRASAEAIGRDRLHAAVAKAAETPEAVDEFVTSGKSHHEILRVAEKWQSDLIVLGVHGRNPIDRMVFGSTAEPVVRRATCPVLTVRASNRAAVAAA